MSFEPILESPACKQQLPAWGVTREFRFGQFVQLFDERIVNGKRQVTPLKFNSDGDVTELDDSLPAATQPASAQTPVSYSLQMAMTSNFDEVLAGETAHTVDVADIDELVRSGMVQVGRGQSAQVELSSSTIAALRAGSPVLTIAYMDGDQSLAVRLQPSTYEHHVDATTLNEILAHREVETGAGRVRLDAGAMQQLIRFGEAYAPVWQEATPGQLVHVKVEGFDEVEGGRPAAERFAIQDLTEFLAAPVIPAVDGRSLVVHLDADQVAHLRQGDRITTYVGDREVQFALRDVGPEPPGADFVLLGFATPAGLNPPKYEHNLRHMFRELLRFEPKFQRLPGDEQEDEESGSTSPPATPPAPNLSRAGLPVAILLPWRQTWTLKGFSRGNLISSLALGPGEEIRISVSAWERRAKAMQQTAETDIEQSYDFTSTTRDTEDVFREITQSNEFAAQAHASLDASYTNGVATVQLGADGSVSNAGSLQATTRSATQHVREATSRASTRVRARRVTTISESIERTTSTETIRTIRNPNACHTLTLNFHEVLAHYDVAIEFNRPAVRIVVLIPNPHHIRTFTDLAVRTHEATLRANLLDPALAEGFEACRLLEAYRRAEDELARLAGMAKRERDQDRQREVPKAESPQKPPNPHTATLKSQLKELKLKYQPYPGADVMPALRTIADWKVAGDADVLSANRWLWRRLVATKFGTGLLEALSSISASYTPEDARRVVAAAPPPTSAPPLDGLGGLPDKDKEEAGLFSATASNFSAGWWWWYPRLKDGRLYDVVDGGIPGLLNQLRKTYDAWEVKESEGEGMQQAAAVVENAKAEQQQATLADRLEMKFGAEVVGNAFERRQALLTHLNEYVDYYRYVLFQAMPPSEQMRRLMDVAPQLRIGMFEPHVVASEGPNLAVPLTPLATTTLAKLVSNLSDVLEQSAAEAQAAGDSIAVDPVILPTPGVSVESWLGECSGCDDHAEALRAAEVRLAVAEARQAEAQATRFESRLTAMPPDLDDPSSPAGPAIVVRIEDDESSPA